MPQLHRHRHIFRDSASTDLSGAQEQIFHDPSPTYAHTDSAGSAEADANKSAVTEVASYKAVARVRTDEAANRIRASPYLGSSSRKLTRSANSSRRSCAHGSRDEAVCGCLVLACQFEYNVVVPGHALSR